MIHIMTKKWCQEPILVLYVKRRRPALAASIEYMTWTTTKIPVRADSIEDVKKVRACYCHGNGNAELQF